MDSGNNRLKMSSSEEEDDNTPEAEVCERLCKEFSEVTNSDTAMGHFYLQDSQWNLEAALNRYFTVNGEKSTGAGSTMAATASDSSESASPGDHGNGSISPSANATDTEPNVLRLLSWNIDGLDQNGGTIRTKAVCTIVLKEKPTVVFLQEVVDSALPILSDYLDDNYWILKGKQASVPTGAYFNAMLLDRNAVELGREPELIPFSGTLMGRTLLKVEVEIFGVPCILMTSHLESTKEMAKERVEQLRHCFDILNRKVPDNVTGFFGGDLNLRDTELTQVGGIPDGVNDLWTVCGSMKECQYTWDCRKNTNLNSFEGAKFKPKARFDRLYIKEATAEPGSTWKPNSFRLVGTERIQKYGRFPSDHWGIMCDLVKTGMKLGGGKV